MRKWLSAILVIALALGLFAVPSSAVSTHQFTVVFKSTIPANAADIVAAAGGQVVATIPEIGVMAVNGPSSLINKLGANAEVSVIGPTLTISIAPMQTVDFTEDAVSTTGADLYNRYQWDIKQVTNNGASWAINSGSHQTVVGVVDTGIDLDHPALQANILGGQNFVPDGPGGVVVPTDIQDRNSHGSHCAGAIAGSGRILGVGPNLGIKAYRVLGANGSGSSTGVLQGIVAAINDKVDVISMSLSGFYGIGNYTWTDVDGTVYRFHDVADVVAYKRVIDYAKANDVIVVAAAGNDATNIANPTAISDYMNTEYGIYGYNFQGASQILPAKLPGVVTVSALGPSLRPSSYTNYGPGAIDVSAPGGDFERYGVDPDWFTDMCLSANKSGTYTWMAGTSMATPKVAGIVAVMIDQAKANGQKLTVPQVIAKLQQTAIDNGKPGYDEWYGYGMANAYRALGGK